MTGGGGDQMGIALQNSRLFGQLSKRSAELQEINTKLEGELVERRKIQEELEKAMELAKAAAVSKNQFLANMSHEVVPYSCFVSVSVFVSILCLDLLKRCGVPSVCRFVHR